MNWKHVVVAGIAVGMLASAGLIATAAGNASVRAPNDRAVGPALPADTGAGELLIAVVGGVFPSRQEAESANEALAFVALCALGVAPCVLT